MSNEKFTPGPWAVDEMEILSNDKLLASVYPTRLLDSGYTDETSISEANANARLISASPTLYEYAANQAKNGCAEAASMLASLKLSN